MRRSRRPVRRRASLGSSETHAGSRIVGASLLDMNYVSQIVNKRHIDDEVQTHILRQHILLSIPGSSGVRTIPLDVFEKSVPYSLYLTPWASIDSIKKKVGVN